jgi:hypothetical protein
VESSRETLRGWFEPVPRYVCSLDMLLKLFISCLLMALPVDVEERLVDGLPSVDVPVGLASELSSVDVTEGLAGELSSVDVVERLVGRLASAGGSDDGLSERR